MAPGRSRYRVYQFLPHLQQAGIDCHVDPLFGARYFSILRLRSSLLQGCFESSLCAGPLFKRLGTLLTLGRQDLIVIEATLSYAPPLIERLLCWLQYRLVFELDDATIYLTHGHERKMPVLLAMAAESLLETIGWPPTRRNFVPSHGGSHGGGYGAICAEADSDDGHTRSRRDHYNCLDRPAYNLKYLDVVAPVLRRLQERYPVKLRVVSQPRRPRRGHRVSPMDLAARWTISRTPQSV